MKPEIKSESEGITADRNRETHFIRNPDIIERQVDDTVFLVNPEDDTIFYLNSLSSGIWRLLTTPNSYREIINIIQQAFPDTSSGKITSDVSKLMKEFERKGLIHHHD